MLVQCAHCCFGGGSGGSRHWSVLVCILRLRIVRAHVCDCAHMVYCITGHSVQSSSPLLLHPMRPPLCFSTSLSFPAVHSCEKQHSAKRDICSVRECPNYSWPFNHSGFGLRGICGVSHKCASATLVNGSFITVVLYSVPPNYHNATCSNSVLSTSGWSL